MRSAFLLALLMSFASLPRAQDASGLGGLPSRVDAGRAKSTSLSANYVSGANYVAGAKSVQAPSITSTDPNAEVASHLVLSPPQASSRAGCERSVADLCYDAGDNHIVYRPARMFMPSIKGLTAENISVRRNGIRLRYSFP